jgi:hypothetical protein
VGDHRSVLVDDATQYLRPADIDADGQRHPSDPFPDAR